MNRKKWFGSAAAPLVLASLLLVAAAPAHAACGPDPASDGDTVTCSLTPDPDGFTSSGVNDLVIGNDTTTGPFDVSGSNNTLINNGTISGAPAVNFVGTSTGPSNVSNNGTITGNVILDFANLSNSGLITGNVTFGDSSDTLTIDFANPTDPVITGTVNGGGGSNDVFANVGSGTRSLDAAQFESFARLAKFGAGTLQLSSPDTFSTITVEAGTLDFDTTGTLAPFTFMRTQDSTVLTSPVDLVANQGEFYGTINVPQLTLGSVAGLGQTFFSGVINGDVVLDNSLTIESATVFIEDAVINGNLTQTANSEMIFDVNSDGTHDLLRVNGDVVADGVIIINKPLSVPAGSFADTFNVLEFTGSMSGSLATLDTSLGGNVISRIGPINASYISIGGVTALQIETLLATGACTVTGTTVVCDGTILQRFSARNDTAAIDGLDITVTDGSSISPSSGFVESAIEIENDTTLTIGAGALLTPGGGADGIVVRGGDNTVTLGGTVIQPRASQDAIHVSGFDRTTFDPLGGNQVVTLPGSEILLTATGGLTGEPANGIYLEGIASNRSSATVGGLIDIGPGSASAGVSLFTSSDATITETGRIIGSSKDGHGIDTVGSVFGFGVQTATVNGEITLSGVQARGVELKDDTQLTVGSSGNLTVLGDRSTNIAMQRFSTAETAGTLTASGPGSPSIAMVLENTLTNTGTVMATGAAGAYRIELDGLLSLRNNFFETTITPSGVLIQGPGNTLINSGLIGSANGAGVEANTAFIAAAFANENNPATNSNLLLDIIACDDPGRAFPCSDGAQAEFDRVTAALAAANPTIIDNKVGGTISGATFSILGSDFVEQVTNAGALPNGVSLGGGNDTLSLDASTGTIGGAINGGGGTGDVFNLIGGTFDISRPVGFETINVQSGATGKGSGTINGAVNVASGATVAPGNSIGTLTTIGDVVFNVGSILEIEAAAAGNADLWDITGSAAIEGGAVNVFASGTFTVPVTYTILTATDGVVGTFSSITVDQADLTASLAYTTNAVSLTLTPATATGGLFINTSSRTATAQNVATQAVTRIVGQQLVLPGGQGVVQLVLNANGSTAVTATIDGMTTTETAAGTLGNLDADGTAGVTPPALPTVSFTGLGNGANTVATSTVRRADGQTTDVTFRTVVTIQAGTTYIDADGTHTSTSAQTLTGTGATAAASDPIPGGFASLGVVSGRIDYLVTDITTTTTNVTDVTFTDQVLVESTTKAELIALLAAFPDIVAAVQALPTLDLPTAGLTPNQRAVAENFNALVLLPGFGATPLQAVFDELAGLTGDAYASALDQLHPEPYDALTEAGINAATRFHARIRDRLEAMTETGTPVAFDAVAFGPTQADSREADAVAMANAAMPANDGLKTFASGSPGGSPFEKRFGVWASGAASHAHRDGGRANIDPDYSGFDLQAGADAVLSERFVAGISAAWTQTAIDVDRRATGSVSVIEAGLYGAFVNGPFMLNAGLAVGHADAEIERRVAFGTIVANPKSDPDWWQWSGHVEASWRQPLGPVTARPFAGIEAVGWDGYTVRETNGGPVGLRVTRGSGSRITSMLGLELTGEIAMDGVTLLPSAKVAWLHHLDGADRTLNAAFLAAPVGSPGFAAQATTDADQFALSLGLGARFAGGVRVEAAYDGAFAANSQSHAGRLNLAVPF